MYNVNQVPKMFQAQVKGRCQLQYIPPKNSTDTLDALRWVDEWVDKAYPDAPDFGTNVQTRSSALSWRFVTNSGQDDGIIRPVIGAKGWPFYPGSSMKGVFRRACTPEQAERYCGKHLPSGDFEPGLLRFHGGYPTDDEWQENLLDLFHPQQDRQVKSDHRSAAYVQISLFKPKINFGISSTLLINATEWTTIWEIWEKALSTGIGCRVCAGYGQPKKHTGNVIYQTQLKGQGAASKSLDNSGEFRPNMFRATIRGHALRIFGGLTDEPTADRLVEQLFGGIRSQETKVGLLGMSFRENIDSELDEFGTGTWAVPTYEVEGCLTWLVTQKLSDPKHEALEKLIKALTRFAVVLGGFGKSWRRADHRLFYSDYYEESRKPLIGCHWQWVGESSLRSDVSVRKLDRVGTFIEQVRSCAKDWMQLQGFKPNSAHPASWREAWHEQNVQVWGRLADDKDNSEAIYWLHGAYQTAIPAVHIPEGSIYRSSVTGRMSEIGRLWHRMYPLVRLVKDPHDPSQPVVVKTRQYLEILTLFPDNLPQSNQFVNFLASDRNLFTKLWPI
jgi:CRISPR-associated protein Cmr6